MADSIWLRRIGKTLSPATFDDQRKLEGFEETGIYKFDFKNARSTKQHRMFFGAIAIALMNWPEDHEFSPNSNEHLRAWLLCKIGYCDVETHVVDDAAMADTTCKIIMASMKNANNKAFAVYRDSKVYVLTPKSIAWDKLKQKEFNHISQKISDLLKSEINLTLSELKEQIGAAA